MEGKDTVVRNARSRLITAGENPLRAIPPRLPDQEAAEESDRQQ